MNINHAEADTPETVKIHISIEISTGGDFDTGMTLNEWNAMSTTERSKLVGGIWEDEAGGHDNGSMYVITEGAKEI